MSDLLDSLPINEEKMHPEEYAKLQPLMPKMPQKRVYILLGIIFFCLVNPGFSKMLTTILPSLQKSSFLVTLIKTGLFVISLFIVFKYTR